MWERNTYILIESTCSYMEIIRVHFLCSNFIRVRMFCNDNSSKLIQGLRHLGVFRGLTSVNIDNWERGKIKGEGRIVAAGRGGGVRGVGGVIVSKR